MYPTPYSNFLIADGSQFDQAQLNFQKCILIGNWMMLTSLTVTLMCVAITFGFDHYFSIASQVTAHIATIVFAGVLKVGYVLRCVGVHGLGHKVF